MKSIITYYPKIFVNHYGRIFKISWELSDFIPDDEALNDIVQKAKECGLRSYGELLNNAKKCGLEIEEVEDPEDGIIVDSVKRL